MSFSYAQVGGNLVRDPESKSTPNGTKNVSFSVGVDKGFGDRKFTSYFNIVAWGDLAEFAAKHLKKGHGVNVSGDLQIRSWDDKQTGSKRYATEIVAKQIDFGERQGSSSSRTESSPRQSSAPAARQQAAPPPRAAMSDDPFYDEEIPF